MIKTFCDLCGKEIESANHQVNFDINAYGCAGLFPSEYNYHVKCARKIEATIKQMMMDYIPYGAEEDGDNDG